MTRRTDPQTTRLPLAEIEARGETLPEFAPVPRKYRHDGWTPERQKAFIAALADTGSVSRACRHINMSTVGAYWLRRQPGAESFRRAWEAALDFGVQRLKDIAYERAIDGQLSPVFVAGQLKGFRRVRNDRLLMFCLRMNARDEHGRRLAASYFDPSAARLSGNPMGGSMTVPARTRAEKDDMNAAIIEHFDPVAMKSGPRWPSGGPSSSARWRAAASASIACIASISGRVTSRSTRRRTTGGIWGWVGRSDRLACTCRERLQRREVRDGTPTHYLVPHILHPTFTLALYNHLYVSIRQRRSQ